MLEHVRHPGLWVDEPTYKITLTFEGKVYRYGFYSLPPEMLENAVLNRIADDFDTSFMDQQDWPEDCIEITFTHLIISGCVWETNLSQFRKYIAKCKKQNL